MGKRRIFMKFMALVLSIVCTLTLPANVVEAASKSYKSDTSINIISQGALDEVLYSKERSVTKLEFDEVSYAYNMEIMDENPMFANVDLWVVLQINNVEYPIVMNGTVEACELSSERLLWQGPIIGEVELNAIEFQAIAGFVKLGEALQLSLSLQPTTGDYTDGATIITFGEDVLTADVFKELQEKIQTKNEVDNVTQEEKEIALLSETANSNFEQIAIQYKPFTNTSISGVGQRLKGYYDISTRRLAVSIMSRCSNVDSYYSTFGVSSTTIDEFSIGLERTGNNYSYIAGIETFGVTVGTTKVLTALLALFEDAMTLLDITFPTSTISEILGNLDGSVSRLDNTNKEVVTVEFGVLESANFDNSGPGIPVIFQLHRNNDSYTGSHNYTLSTTIRYSTYLQQTYPASTQLLYTQAEDTSYSVNISLNN